MEINWEPVTPHVYRKGDLYQKDSPDCTSPTEIYRWINMDISTDWICDGTTKYYKQKKQVSYDNGQTWQDVIPYRYQRGDVYEMQSTDCGYVIKFQAAYNGGQTYEYEKECDGNATLTSGDTKPSGYDYTAMTSAVIGNCVTNIGDWAFGHYHPSLSSVTISNSVTTIGGHAFQECSGLTSVVIPNSVTSIGIQAFAYCSGLTSVSIGNSVTTIANGAFVDCYSLTGVTIPNSVTSIGIDAFGRCYNLTSIIISNSVTNISDYAFSDCYSLTCVTIPNSVTSIGRNAFYQCSGLTSVVIPNSVTSIGEGAFHSCAALTSVTIPNSVTNIGAFAFRDCSGLTSITVEAITPPVLGNDDYVFYDTNNCPIIVPAQSLSAYKSAWPQYADRITSN